MDSQGFTKCLKQESNDAVNWMGNSHPESRFTCDHVAGESISQGKLFRVAGKMVEKCLLGHKCCMLAYGQVVSMCTCVDFAMDLASAVEASGIGIFLQFRIIDWY
jgi:hypothetical protein